jgi:predicted Zn finger-like uncharacterized protein
MFTVCPKCALTLVVTAADLRVAQGYVRCGRCSSVFNALARLTEERHGAGEEPAAPPAASDSAATSTPSAGAGSSATTESAAARSPDASLPSPQAGAGDEAIPEDALEFNPAITDAAAVFVERAPDPQWTAATGDFRAMLAARGDPPPEPASTDTQVDVEIDAAFLAAMLSAEPSAPVREAPRADPAPEPPAQPPRTAPPATPAPQARSAAAPNRSAAARVARHAAPHTRPSVEAAVRPPAAARTHEPSSGSPETAPASSSAEAAAPGTTAAARRTTATHRAAARPAREKPPAQSAQLESDEADDSANLTAVPRAVAGSEGALAGIRARLSPHTWSIGAAVALVLLVGQIINHYRDDLAAGTRLGRPLTALYGFFGVKLTPRWDLHAYDVRQLGAAVDPAGDGLITVRASIKNAAQHPQPLPLLRVTLQDRFGNRIAARDVAPRSYLPRTMPASSFLSGGQRIDAEMGFVDPGANAVGFEIDACLPTSGGGVTCANDDGAR